MTHKAGNINWSYSGKADFLFGNGATAWEKGLVLAGGSLGILLYLYLFITGTMDWTWWQYLLAVLIAMDVFAGLVANSLNSCKRFYHTQPKPDEPRYTSFFKNHFLFVILHVYPLLASLIFGNGNFIYGVFWYFLMIFCAWIIIKTPLYLKRPVSFLWIATALLLNFYLIPGIDGFVWLIPALFIKILYGYLVQEEPYRPLNEFD
ncbi:MAG TPA: hypothetical protein VK856_08155 [Anaerolineaceae bacterium]|nr:hypothetical protein [Anaerolineaceae bacterium]